MKIFDNSIMKHRLFLSVFFLALSLNPFKIFAHQDTLTFLKPAFSENKGQWNDKVAFRAKISNGNLWVEKDGLRFQLRNADDLKDIAEFKSSYGYNIAHGKKIKDRVRNHVYKISFKNYSPQVKVEGFEAYDDYENYFLGNDPAKWTNHVKKFKYVIYSNLYPKVDLKIFEDEGFLKWDFMIQKGGNPKDIQMEYLYVDHLKLKNGNLTIQTNAGKIVEMKPLAYYINASNEKIPVECDFLLKNNIVSFKLGKYNPSFDLIIDPILVYASYTGSVSDNWGYTATYDYNGYIFAGGSVFGSNYPLTTGAYDTTFAGNGVDVGITKFDPSSSNLIYSTFLGGVGADVPSSLVVNSADELFIMGTTGSSNFPTLSNSYDNSFNGGASATLTTIIHFNNGSDLYIARLSSDGTQLLGSTYLGGNNIDGLNMAANLDYNYADKVRGEVLIDKNNNCYVVSSTNSTNLPTNSSVFQPNKGSLQDGFIAKLDNNLSNLIWCSYLGGNNQDAVYAVALDSKEDIVVSGGTSSTNLPSTSNVFQPLYGGGSSDGFVAKINKNGNYIQALSYYGTFDYDQAYFVDIDRKDHIYLYGQSKDTGSYFIQNAQWNKPGGGQFVSKFDKNINQRIWSTNWGTNYVVGPDVSPSAFMVDLCNRVYMSAWGGLSNTQGSTNGLPVSNNAFQSTTDGSDYYFLVLRDDVSAMDYATFYGGAISHEHVDGGTSRFDNRGKLYQSVCAGCGGHDDFPTTTGAHSATNNSTNCNNAVIKFDFLVPVVIADFVRPPVGCAPYNASFVSTSYVTTANATCHWDFGNGVTSNSCNTSYTYTQGGIYNVQLIITDSASCNISDTLVHQVAVISGRRDTLATKQICYGDFTQIGLIPINDPNITYSWNNSTTLSSSQVANPIAHPLSTTYYTLLLSNGICTDTLVQKVKVLHIQADAGNDTTLCLSSINLQAHGNSSSLSYLWSSNNTFTDTLNSNLNDSNIVTSIIGPTYFYVKIMFSNTCFDYDSVLVSPRIRIDTLNVAHPKCFGDSNGSIQVQAIGGNGPYNYSWSNGSNSASINQLADGLYTITVTDQDGCFGLDTINLIQPALLTKSSNLLNIPCEAACIGKAWSTPSGGVPPYQWIWDDPGNQTTNPATQLCAGTYHVTVSDKNNCVLHDTIHIIDSSIFIQPNVWADKDTIYEGQSVQLHSNFYGLNYIYSWQPATGLNASNIHNPLASPTTSTQYILKISEANGCEWYDTVFIYVIDVICEEPYIFVPNAFTPDGDGKNDILYVRSSVGYEMEFRIFNRWGEMVFESFDVNHGWDGKYKGKLLEPQVFDYYVKLQCYNHEVFLKKGNISLIR